MLDNECFKMLNHKKKHQGSAIYTKQTHKLLTINCERSFVLMATVLSLVKYIGTLSQAVSFRRRKDSVKKGHDDVDLKEKYSLALTVLHYVH